MANTIRELIILNLITRAGLILTASGYNTNIGANVQRVRQNLDPDELPATVVWPGEEEAAKQYGKSRQEMPVKFEGLALFGAVNPSVISEKILGDLIKAFTLSDPTGGLAESVTYKAGGTEGYPADGELAIGCAATFNVVYEYDKGRPCAWEVPFNSGGTYEVQVGDVITGAVSGKTATVQSVSLTSGAWGDGDAAGTFEVSGLTGNLGAENLNVGAHSNVATTTGVTY